jgi:rubrerythrin
MDAPMDPPSTIEAPESCPKCGSERLARFLYGVPHLSKELREKLKKGEIIIGSCVLRANEPKWQCRKCGHKWR